MAYEELREETGLIFVHLNPTQVSERSLSLFDRRGVEHAIDLNKLPFVLQRKAELASFRLKRLKADPSSKERAINSLKSLFVMRARKGFTDRRQVFKKNYGFIGDRAMQIDVGKIRKDRKIAEAPHQDTERILKKFDLWLLKHSYSPN